MRREIHFFLEVGEKEDSVSSKRTDTQSSRVVGNKDVRDGGSPFLSENPSVTRRRGLYGRDSN